jgi:hypothetical protein
MPWQAKVRQALPGVAWICLVLAVAAYGAAIVRNVTDVLAAIAGHPRSVVVMATPNR